MYDKFGEFDSYMEINRAAAAQLKEGDLEAIRKIAEENGIEREDVDDYIDGAVEELTTPLMAAIGKIQTEAKDLKLGGILEDWVNELIGLCTENPDFALAVRKKGKELAGYIAATAENGYQNRVNVDKRIVEKAPVIKKIVGSHGFAIGIPDKKTRRELAHKYYMGEMK